MLLFDAEHYLFSLHALAVLALGAGALCLGTFVLVNQRASRIGLRFFSLQAAISLWLLPYGMAYASLQEAAASGWFRVGSFGVMIMPVSFVILTATVINQEREFRWLIRTSAAACALFCLSLLTTDLFSPGLLHYSWGVYPAYGPVGRLFLAYFAGISALSLFLFYRAYRASTYPRNRQRFQLILSAIGIALVSAVDFAPSLGVPLFPFGFAPLGVSLLLLFWLALRNRLVDITPELATGQILETMQGAVIVADLEGTVRVVNRAALELLGYGKSDVLGKDLKAVLSLPAAMGDAVPANGRAAFRETVWQGRDGRRHEVSVSASQLADDRDGTLLGTVYVAHDITERKQAEERLRDYSAELQKANRKLEGLDKLKSDFVSTVSHELRTPLTSIKAFVELILLKQPTLPEKTLKLLRIINDESDRLGRLISDLLDLSRIEAGAMAWRTEPVSLNDVINASVDGIVLLARNKRLQFKTTIEGPLPSVHGSRDRLVQVVTNLLSNAVKFTPEGGTVTVEARCETGPPPQLVVTVSDSGTGIPAKDIDLIFDKFHRSSDELTTQTDGTGPGLTIARQIIEHHGGRNPGRPAPTAQAACSAFPCRSTAHAHRQPEPLRNILRQGL